VKRALILAEGRLKEPLLRQACEEYYSRCRRSLPIEERELKDLRALKQAIPDPCTLVVLDERGRELSSLEFARALGRSIERPGAPIVFVIGGADGLDDELRGRAGLLLALGRMTFAHRLVRLLLAEQLYRAVSILEGSPYHREG